MRHVTFIWIAVPRPYEHLAGDRLDPEKRVVARRDSEIAEVLSGHGRVPVFGAGHAVNS
jgi:hypothetical protein